MRNLKRALSLGMTAAMISGLVVTTGAASYPDVTSSDNVEAIEVLQMAGVMAGDENGKFNPQQNVTRAEMAVVMCNLLGLRVNDYQNASIPFTDVPEWAHKYVAACYAEGITGGTSATTYGSNASVTTAQAALMLMKALGYFQYNSDFGSDWQLATVNQASKIDLFDGIDAGATAALTRNEVAQLALNTLEANMVEVTGSEGITINGITVGSTIEYKTIYKGGDAYDNIDKTDKDGEKYAVQLGEELYDGKLEKKDDADDFNRDGHMWSFKDSKGVTTDSAVYVENADYVQVVTDAKDTLSDVAEDASKKLKLDGKTKVYLNADEDVADMELKVGDIVEFRGVDDNVAGSVNVIRYTISTIDDVDTDVKDADADDGVSAYIDVKGFGRPINNTDIVGYNEDTYVEDAVIGYVPSKDGKEIIASYIATSVKGAITAYVADKSYTIGGTKYTLAGVAVDDVDGKVDFDDGNYKLYLDPNGYVVKTETIKGSVSLSDVFYVGVIKGTDIFWTEYDNGKTDNTRYYVQAVYLDGTVEDILVAEASNDAECKAIEAKLTAAGYYTDSKQDVTVGDKTVELALTKWTDKDYDTKFSATVTKIDSDTKSVDGIYVNKDTKYVVIEAYKDSDIKVTVKTGSISYEKETEDVVDVIYKTTDGSKVAQYVVINAKDFTAADTGDYVYVVDADTYVNVADGKQYTAYDQDGKEINIVVDKKDTVKDGFYTYTVDEDGIYSLKSTAENSNFKSGKFVSYYGDLITVEGLKVDLDAADAVIIDVHDTDADGQYSKAVTSLSAMYTASKDNKYDVMLELVVNSDDEVEYIVVTSVVEK